MALSAFHYIVPFGSALAGILIVSYILLTSFTVFNTNKRATLETAISQKTEKVTALETELSKLKSAITPKFAEAKGFVEVKNPKYLNTKPITSALRPNEI